MSVEVPLRSSLPSSAPDPQPLGVLADNSSQLYPFAENYPQQMKVTSPGNT